MKNQSLSDIKNIVKQYEAILSGAIARGDALAQERIRASIAAYSHCLEMLLSDAR